MSFVADFIGGAVEAVGNVVESVANTVGNIVDGNPLAAIAAAALAIATSGASLAADVAAVTAEGTVAAGDALAYVTAAETAPAMALDVFAPVPVSTLDIYTGAASAAVNTSVADYAAAAVAGAETGAATAFTAIPLQSLGAATASAGFLETAIAAAKGVKTAVDVVQIVNLATQQKSMVPRNAPVPAGWALDSRWNPTLGTMGASFQYDPATGAILYQQPEKPAVNQQPAAVPASGNLPPVLALAAVAAAVLYLVKP